MVLSHRKPKDKTGYKPSFVLHFPVPHILEGSGYLIHAERQYYLQMAVALRFLARHLRPVVLSILPPPSGSGTSYSTSRVVIISQIKNQAISANTVSQMFNNLPVLNQQLDLQSKCCGDDRFVQQCRCSHSFLKGLPVFHMYNSLPNLYKQFSPGRNGCGDEKIFQSESSNSYLRGLPKSFNFRRKPRNEEVPKKKKKRVPKLILIQNPFTWLMIKIDFSVLRNIWDPTFHEKEFKYGTKQAISRITHVISSGHYAELNGLLTKAARLSLLRELERNWGDKQRSLLALKHEDIQISSPRKVYFIRIADKKFCDVDMAFLALKWAPINSIEALIFAEIFARFHREYTPHCIPEWTIAYFKVTRFEVLRR